MNKLMKKTKNGKTKKTFKCLNCDKEFSSYKSKLNHEIKIHTHLKSDQKLYGYNEKQKIFKCYICYEDIENENDVIQHTEEHEVINTCCTIDFKDNYAYAIHMYDHKNIYQCPICMVICKEKSSLKKHIIYRHFQHNKFTCAQCNKSFSYVKLYKKHLLSHEKEDSSETTCVVCERSFAISRYLVLHQMRTHTANFEDKPFRCHTCHKVFHTSSCYENHLKTHEVICDICGKKFNNVYKLNLHSRRHTGIKPYTCETCGKCFAKSGTLVDHIRTHTGERPYACKFCDKRFTQRPALNTHVRMHTGKKPYVCHICNSAYTSKPGLTLHFKSCRGPLM